MQSSLLSSAYTFRFCVSSQTSLPYLLPWSSSIIHLAKRTDMLLSMSCECQMLPVQFQLRSLQLLSAWQYIEFNWLNGRVARWIREVNIVLRQAKAQCFTVAGNLAAVLFRKSFQQLRPILEMVLIITKLCTARKWSLIIFFSQGLCICFVTDLHSN